MFIVLGCRINPTTYISQLLESFLKWQDDRLRRFRVYCKFLADLALPDYLIYVSAYGRPPVLYLSLVEVAGAGVSKILMMPYDTPYLLWDLYLLGGGITGYFIWGCRAHLQINTFFKYHTFVDSEVPEKKPSSLFRITNIDQLGLKPLIPVIQRMYRRDSVLTNLSLVSGLFLMHMGIAEVFQSRRL